MLRNPISQNQHQIAMKLEFTRSIDGEVLHSSVLYKSHS